MSGLKDALILNDEGLPQESYRDMITFVVFNLDIDITIKELREMNFTEFVNTYWRLKEQKYEN